MIRAERFPNSFHVYQGRHYAKQVVTYHLPYSGKEILLKCTPSQSLIWTEEVRLEGGSICYDIINWQDDAESIKTYGNNFLDNIFQQAEFLTKEVAKYNSNLENQVRQVVQGRKALLLKQMTLCSSLGVPFYKTQNALTCAHVTNPYVVMSHVSFSVGCGTGFSSGKNASTRSVLSGTIAR